MPGKGLARLLGSLAALAFILPPQVDLLHTACSQYSLQLECWHWSLGFNACSSLPASLQHEVRHVGVEDAVDFCYLFPSESAILGE